MKRRRVRPAKLTRLKYLVYIAAIALLFVPKGLYAESQVAMRTLVSAIGIDVAEGGDGYAVSAQLFLPQAGEGGGEAKKTVTTEGRTLAEALDLVKLKCGRGATAAQCYLVVVGADVCEKGLLAPLDFFMQSTRVNWNALLAATSGKAADTLDALTRLEDKGSFSWENYLNQSRRNGQAAALTVKEFLSAQYGEGGGGYLMLLDPDAQKEDDAALPGAIAAAQRTLLIREGKTTGTLTAADTRTLGLLDRKSRAQVFTFRDEAVEGGAPVAVALTRKRAHIKVRFVGDTPVAEIGLRGSFTVEERDRPGALTPPAADDAALKEAIERRLTAQIEALFERSKTENTDFLALQDLFFRTRHKAYEAYGGEKADFLQRIVPVIKVTAQLNHA